MTGRKIPHKTNMKMKGAVTIMKATAVYSKIAIGRINVSSPPIPAFVGGSPRLYRRGRMSHRLKMPWYHMKIITALSAKVAVNAMTCNIFLNCNIAPTVQQTNCA